MLSGMATGCVSFIQTGHLYVKSDVYGFGVVLLEMPTHLIQRGPQGSRIWLNGLIL